MPNEDRDRLIQRVVADSRRHYAAYTLFNQALAEHLGLHPTDLQCLSLLSLEAEPLTTGEIARLTGLTSGSATRLVDRLDRAGLVVRQSDPGDRRKTLVSLAPRPVSEVDAAWETPGEAFLTALDDFTDEQLAVIGDYLRRVSAVGAEQAARLASARGSGRKGA
ncbi:MULTISPECIES: MarR family winged helix-turn-helix transcriptional regulator [Streptosporangium]|uniref:DNA-binding MarR family transcriptional regulator n=1 Tax=Streptosporangium brasiliense TaxID=47480 RepID=A0ABT9RF97_9ACTN|nr:MarR family transcriptional regulator [Streptosporangium brasiliense]MDP9867803.1 DNA-binding MarR family transcriptional regulator [Streptosporangium brasiliense]